MINKGVNSPKKVGWVAGVKELKAGSKGDALDRAIRWHIRKVANGCNKANSFEGINNKTHFHMNCLRIIKYSHPYSIGLEKQDGRTPR